MTKEMEKIERARKMRTNRPNAGVAGEKPKSEKLCSALSSIAQACPNCGQASSQGYAPFCCKRCADVDLHRWTKGVYRIPGEQA